MVNPQDVYVIVSALALALGAIGGIPQIFRWFTPKPSLKITELQLRGTERKNNYLLHLKVLNEAKWWRKNADAKHVRGDMMIIDKNHEQRSCRRLDILPLYLPPGISTSKEISFIGDFKSEEPYTIRVVVSCGEGVRTKEEITYQM